MNFRIKPELTQKEDYWPSVSYCYWSVTQAVCCLLITSSKCSFYRPVGPDNLISYSYSDDFSQEYTRVYSWILLNIQTYPARSWNW